MAQKRRTLLSLVLLWAFGFIALNPQASVAQETIELRVWDQFTDPQASDTADAIYAAFMKQNPNITITREVVQLDQMRQTVNTAIASGTGPDVIFYDTGAGYAGVLAEAGLLTPLDEFAAQYGWADRVTSSALEATTLNGQLYGMPLQVDLIGMFYNQTLIEQEGLTVPTTMGEFLTFCQQASEKGYIPLAFTNNPGWQAFHQFSMVTNNMIGPEAMQQLLFNNQGSWDSPEITQAIQSYFVDMREAGCFSEDVNALTNDDAAALFQSGQALMYPTGSWMVPEFGPETMPDMDVQMMPFPELEGGQGSYWVSGVGSAYFISSASQHQAEAAAFINHLFQPEAVNQWVAEAGFIVPVVDIDTSGMDISPLFQNVLGELGKVEQFGYNIDVIAPTRFNETMQNGFQEILAGNKTAEQQAADLQAAWEASWTPPTGTPPAGTPAT